MYLHSTLRTTTAYAYLRYLVVEFGACVSAVPRTTTAHTRLLYRVVEFGAAPHAGSDPFIANLGEAGAAAFFSQQQGAFGLMHGPPTLVWSDGPVVHA